MSAFDPKLTLARLPALRRLLSFSTLSVLLDGQRNTTEIRTESGDSAGGKKTKQESRRQV